MNTIKNMYEHGSLCFLDFECEEDKIWFAAENLNGLFEADLHTGTAKLIMRFSGERVRQRHLYQQVIRWENTLLFIPGLAVNFVIYDIVSGQIREIPVRKDLAQRDIKFGIAVHYGYECYIEEIIKSCVVKVNLQNLEITYLETSEDCSEHTQDFKRLLLKKNEIASNEFVYGVKEGLIYSEKGIIYVQEKQNISSINIPKQIAEKITKYIHCERWEDRLLISTDTNIIVILDVEKKECSWVEIPLNDPENYFFLNRIPEYIYCMKVINDIVYVLLSRGNKFICFDSNWKKEELNKLYPDKYTMMQVWLGQSVFQEDDYICLDFFLQDAFRKEAGECRIGKCGSRIYAMIEGKT